MKCYLKGTLNTTFFFRRFWIAVGNVNFQHTHLDLIYIYILEFY